MIRLGTCKRSAARLKSDLGKLDRHVQRIFDAHGRCRGWTVEKVAIAPVIAGDLRRAIIGRGYFAEDLGDLTAGL